MSVLDAGLRRLYEAWGKTGLPVFIGGSIASMWFGEPRSTLDIDLIVSARPGDEERIVAAFPADEFYVPPPDAIRAELERDQGGQFNVLDLASGLKADIYVAGNDPLIAFGFENAFEREFSGGELNLAPATYVVAMKLRFYGISQQDKHLRDIRSMLAISPEELDHEEISRWASQFRVLEAWRACLQKPGEE